MRGLIKASVVSGMLLLAFAALASPEAAFGDDRDNIVLVYKDGHRQALATAEIGRIDLKSPAQITYKDGHKEKLPAEIDHIEFGPAEMSFLPGRSHYVGKWEVGEGSGNAKFFITLESDGEAKKSIGETHGTWTLVDGEARITWDDGWRDIIRKVGTQHEKVAFGPGKTFSDSPSNVTAARNTQPKPI